MTEKWGKQGMETEMEHFSTEAWARFQRLSQWNDLMSQRLTAVDIDAEKDFNAALSIVPVGAASVLSVSGDKTTIQASRDGLRRSRAPSRCGLIFHDVRSSEYQVNGQEKMVNEGEFIFVDLTSDFRSRMWEDGKEIIVVHVPTAELLAQSPHALQHIGMTGSSHRGAGAILHSFVRNCIDNHADMDCARYQNVLIELMLLALTGFVADDEEADMRAMTRSRAIELVEANLRDPDLGTGFIASRMGVSERYIQLIFADISCTPSSFIRAMRLDCVKQELIRRNNEKISQIAYDVGFNDLSQFNRSFRSKFGVSPSRYRRRVG